MSSNIIENFIKIYFATKQAVKLLLYLESYVQIMFDLIFSLGWWDFFLKIKCLSPCILLKGSVRHSVVTVYTCWPLNIVHTWLKIFSTSIGYSSLLSSYNKRHFQAMVLVNDSALQKEDGKWTSIRHQQVAQKTTKTATLLICYNLIWKDI